MSLAHIGLMRTAPMKRVAAWLLLAFLVLLPFPGNAAPSVRDPLVPDTTLPTPPLHFDDKGALLISPSATSSRHDLKTWEWNSINVSRRAK